LLTTNTPAYFRQRRKICKKALKPEVVINIWGPFVNGILVKQKSITDVW
jgi:hypothetical protein